MWMSQCFSSCYSCCLKLLCLILQLCTRTIHLRSLWIRISWTLGVFLKIWGLYIYCWLVERCLWSHMLCDFGLGIFFRSFLCNKNTAPQREAGLPVVRLRYHTRGVVTIDDDCYQQVLTVSAVDNTCGVMTVELCWQRQWSDATANTRLY